ncbi:hypothetical protein HQ587_04655 [bacterium]|nr:hypothetical protein [bacterium]
MVLNRYFLVLTLLWVLGSVAAAEEGDIIVLVSGAYRARVNGCDCPGGMTGGLATRFKLVSELFPKRIPTGMDCGGILDLDPEGGKLASRCAFFGLARQGLRVLGVTPRDLFYGINFLKSIADSAGIQLISANLIVPESGRRIFKPWITIEIDGVRLAVTSLVNYQAGRRFTAPIGWTRIAPETVLEEILDNIPVSSDYIILLTDMSEDDLRKLLPQYPQFDLALTSSRKFKSGSSFTLGKTLVAHPRMDGQSLDWIVFHPDSPAEFNFRPLPVKAGEEPETARWLKDCLGR